MKATARIHTRNVLSRSLIGGDAGVNHCATPRSYPPRHVLSLRQPLLATFLLTCALRMTSPHPKAGTRDRHHCVHQRHAWRGAVHPDPGRHRCACADVPTVLPVPTQFALEDLGGVFVSRDGHPAGFTMTPCAQDRANSRTVTVIVSVSTSVVPKKTQSHPSEHIFTA